VGCAASSATSTLLGLSRSCRSRVSTSRRFLHTSRCGIEGLKRRGAMSTKAARRRADKKYSQSDKRRVANLNYSRKQDVMKRRAEYRESPEYKEVWRRSHRKRVHSFTEEQEQRFLAATTCDWCGYAFDLGELPHIDHDRRCCPTMKHCESCTRGFVHANCNILGITHAEWLLSRFGALVPTLAAYYTKFPRRVV
jgi:hypothetical protein